MTFEPAALVSPPVQVVVSPPCSSIVPLLVVAPVTEMFWTFSFKVQPLLINKDMSTRRASLGVTLTGKEALSYLGVPVVANQQAIGVISVQSIEQEGQFDENDLRLLTTLASNVGVAIEKARLLDETQRRARETEAIAEVGREISATLDLSTLHHRAPACRCHRTAGLRLATAAGSTGIRPS